MKTVNITAKSNTGFRIDVEAGNHTLVVDQPSQMGGQDEGASPLDYLLAAWGSCLATVAVIVAKQERIKMNGISVAVEGDVDLDVLMGKSTENRAGFFGIKVSADVDAPGLSLEGKKAFLKKVEARCPVTDNLVNTTPVTMEVV